MIDLVRRWAVDWLASHDPSTCDEIMSEDYTLEIGAITLDGRADYVSGTMGQLAIFPGLCLTVHDVFATPDHAAVRFTEHGAGTHKDGRPAAWGGIALFESDGRVITRTWAEEDYLSRSRQLSTDGPDVVEAPTVAPWDVAVSSPDPSAEAAVRAWLADGLPGGVVLDDGWLHADASNVVTDLELDVLFSGGDRVAFHGRSTDASGYRRGVAALLTVTDGQVTGRMVTDRLGARAHARRTAQV